MSAAAVKSETKYALALIFDVVLGFQINRFERGSLNEDQKNLIEMRDIARAAKDFQKADEIRQILLEQGVILQDTESGTRFFKE